MMVALITFGDFLFQYDQIHGSSTTSEFRKIAENSQDLRGKKIFVGIPSYDHSQYHYLETMLDNMRNICEAGALVNVNIYTTIPYSVETIHLLNSKTRCLNSVGQLKIKVKLYPPSITFRLVDVHRKDFYDNLQHYDLFIYTEDDHDIQARHVVAYLSETEKLKQNVGIEEFPKYSIGFVRYEMSEDKEVTFDQFAWENLGLTPFVNEESGSYHDHPLRFKYLKNLIFPYQGMYMATREQLRFWRDSCNFDQGIIVNKDLHWHREYVANLRLFENIRFPDDNCHVIQVLPLDDSFVDFYVHHMSDKYFKRFQVKMADQIDKNTMDTLSLQRMRLNFMVGSGLVTQQGNYDGIVTEIGEYEWKDDESMPDLTNLEDERKRT